jgi:hypothetical protein
MDASSAKSAMVRRSKKTKAIAQSMITPKSMIPSKSKSAAGQQTGRKQQK